MRLTVSTYPPHLSIVQTLDVVDALPIPVIREMSPLGRDRDHVGPEDRDALALGKVHAGPGDAVRSDRAALPSEDLGCAVVVGVQQVGAARGVVEIGVDRPDQLAELRGPARRLVGGAHEAGVVMDGLGDRHLGAVARVVEAEAAIREPPGPERRAMHEGRHDPACAGPGHAAGDGHLGEIADALADARVELGLGRGQRLPVGRIGDVLEEVDGRVDRADDADRPRPGHAPDRDIHQAPRSASR